MCGCGGELTDCPDCGADFCDDCGCWDECDGNPLCATPDEAL